MILRVRWEDYGTEKELLDEIYELPILARSLTVEINDYTEADTFQCEIDYKSFPFDPRTIRACGVSIHMEDRKKIFNLNNTLSLLEPSEENTVFLGFADEEKITFDDTKRTVRMEGRDFTSLMIDRTYLGPAIPLSSPIDVIIEKLLAELPETKKMTLDIRIDETLPTLSEIAPDFNPVTTKKNARSGSSYWDIIQRIIGRAGLIAYVDLDKLVITKPQNLYQKAKILQFFYGKNLSHLEFSRKLGRHKNFNIKVQSLNIEKKEVVEALIPEEATDPNIAGPRVKIKTIDSEGQKTERDAEFISFRVPDVASKDHLIKIGESIFTELSRQQLEGKLRTKEMEIPQISDVNSTGNPIPVSFHSLRTGTPIQVIITQDDMDKISTLSSINEKKRFLIQRGYTPQVAEAFAQSLNRMSDPFYTKAVRYTLDNDSGFQMEVDFINFIELDNANLSV